VEEDKTVMYRRVEDDKTMNIRMEEDNIIMNIRAEVDKGVEKNKINHHGYRKRLGHDRHGQDSGREQHDY